MLSPSMQVHASDTESFLIGQNLSDDQVLQGMVCTMRLYVNMEIYGINEIEITVIFI